MRWQRKILMYLIRLKKAASTKTSNNNYDVMISRRGGEKVIGSYNQINNKLILDIKVLIYVLSSGAVFSKNFSMIFRKTTGLLATKENVKVKF
jgi:hypothetical protein